jgi:hypothetical protein
MCEVALSNGTQSLFGGKSYEVIKGFYEVCQLIKGAKLSEAGLSAFLYSTCGKALRISSTVSL